MKQVDHSVPYPTRLSLMRFFLSGSKRIFVIGMLSASLVSLLDMLVPRIITFTVDSVIGSAPPDLPAFMLRLTDRIGGIAHLKARPAVIAGFVIYIALLAAVFRYLFHVCNEIAAERLVKRMRDSLFAQIQRLTCAWHGDALPL